MSDSKNKRTLESELLSVTEAALGTRYGFVRLPLLLALVVDAIFIYSVTGLNPLSVYGSYV